MPFAKQKSRVFNKATVENLKPDQHGVYGLFKKDVCVYVGKGDIRKRLLAHLNGDNPRITTQAPTRWVDEVTANADAREKELIVELDPECNRQVG